MTASSEVTAAEGTQTRLATEAGRQAVIKALEGAEKLIVVAHENPDGDAIGSLIGMQHVLSALGKDCLLFIAEHELPLRYEYGFLPLEGLISEPPADIDERMIVFLDCGNIERNPAAQVLHPQASTMPVLNIDHHHDNTRFGTANYVDPEASSTAEIIWGLAHALGVKLTPNIASALYVGLITDTGCFMYSNTSPRAHFMAAELIDAGVDVHLVYQQVYEDVPFGKLALLAKGLEHVERYDDGRLTVSHLTAEDFELADADDSYSEGVVDHLRAVRGTAMAALARDRLAGPGEAAEDANGARVRKVSLRASDMRIDVSVIARALGGGGHPAAAGFTTSLGWEELIAFLREQLAAQLDSQ